jgi:hypothetical protein
VLVVCNRVTEHRQKSVTGGVADMAFVALHRAQHQLAIPTHQEPIRLRLYPRRQHRRIHQIGEEDRQPPDLTRITRRRKQVLGLGVRSVGRQHLPCQRRRGRTITAVDRHDGLIQKIINRRLARPTGLAVRCRTDPTVAHSDNVASLLGAASPKRHLAG